jgi:RNA polymerase sigma-70 factor, ECF subfamily
MLGDAGRAADTIKDAMILAFWGAPRFRSGDAVTTWFYRIVVNVCLDRMRRAPPRGDDRDLIAAMRHLVVEQQSALVLVDMLGFSVAYASSILGVPAGALLDRCARGRVRLRAELTHQGRQAYQGRRFATAPRRLRRSPDASLWPGFAKPLRGE